MFADHIPLEFFVQESELIDRIKALEETPVLLECSRRAKRRFGLRGGLLRNLLLSKGGRRSVFDYTDPFSDLDKESAGSLANPCVQP